MKKLTLQEKQNSADALLKRINALHKPGETVRLMEVCGTHTVSIFREGLRQLLPSGIELVSGPGCPVCVTDQTYMDKALAYAERDDVIIATFGDMLKVPGSYSSLSEAQTRGAHIHVIYTPLEVVELSKKYPEKKIVFLAIGFETTIAVICATVKAVHAAGLKNVDAWRGIGVIPNSGLRLKDEYAAYDVERALPIHLERPSLDPKGCQCGRVLQGLIKPSECPLFGKSCTADHPVGACMVSVEGSCAAWYKYGYSSGGSTWED